MKRILFVSLFCFRVLFCIEAQSIKLFHEKKDRVFIIYGNNYELYPVSLSLNLSFSNLVFSESEKRIFVLPPKSEKFKIGELRTESSGVETRFNYDYKYAMGDVTIKNYDKTFIYDLPFQKGKGFKLFQGYNGTFSHKNENALDFTMPEGTEVLASRSGTIVQVVQNNTESCPTEDCKKYNNYIIVMHSDGTFAYYAHIKYNGAKYKPGEYAKQGDVIAYSGNVGWSGAPHLHFVCFLGGFEKWQTFETQFKTGKGDTSEMLKEGSQYMRDY